MKDRNLFKRKSLIKKMAYGTLITTCGEQGWRLPFFNEIEGSEDSGWVIYDTASPDDRLTWYWDGESQTLQLINKNFIQKCSVMREVKEKTCPVWWEHKESKILVGFTIVALWVAFLIVLSSAVNALTPQCESATWKATLVHVQYMEGNATLTDSYNANNKMKEICKDD